MVASRSVVSNLCKTAACANNWSVVALIRGAIFSTDGIFVF